VLRLNIGISKKVGESNFGSRGASANLELEVEGSLVDQPDRLKERIRFLFGLATASVEEELNGQAAPVSNGHSANGRRRDPARKATGSQARALHQIADRQGVDLAGLLRQRFGVELVGDISISEASALIDELKASNGAILELAAGATSRPRTQLGPLFIHRRDHHHAPPAQSQVHLHSEPRLGS
jgi:hypothetical protein